MDEPIVEGVDEQEDEGVSSSERKLLWAVIVLLTIAALVQAAWILRGRLVEGETSLAMVNTPASEQNAADPVERAPNAVEPRPPPAGGMVAGQDNVRRVAEAFVAAREIEASVGAEVVEMLVQSERRIEALPSRVQSGDIEADQVGILGGEELALRQTEMQRLLGPERAADLAQVLSGGSL